MVPPLARPRLSPRSRSGSRRRDTAKAVGTSSTLAEALRTNPFRTSSRETLPESDAKDEAQELKDLNADLQALANIFPDVKVEVLRELLTRFDGRSRLEISAEQLFKYKAEWVQGRLVIPPREPDQPVSRKELFKSPDYAAAVRKTLALEFRGLTRSAIDAVLAEVNYSYTNARPICQDLSSKSWRVAFQNFFKKRRADEDIPSCHFIKGRLDAESIHLLETGSTELDEELQSLFLRPLLQLKKQVREEADHQQALALNQQEAEDAEALYECQVCYSDSPFEAVSVCTTGEHVICYDCIRRTMHEALFGQGWASSVNTTCGSLKCIAPSAGDDCQGWLQQLLAKQAIISEKAGIETWAKFEDRLAADSLQKSRFKVVSCPFCSYVEAEQLYDPKDARRLRWHIKTSNVVTTVITILALVNILPFLLFLLLPATVFFHFSPKDMFYQSLAHLSLRNNTPRFSCQRPTCKRRSCLNCAKAWYDPHTCHEPLLLSLRTTVEAARTAAIKRTCPRCGTSFVKASGCNKLTCVCGYAMCYICRKNIGGDTKEGEGYRHFCEHFRPMPGRSCTECNKCDLYAAEDEDAAVRAAGEQAEKEWRIKEGMVGVKGLDEAAGRVDGHREMVERVLRGEWTVQGMVDLVVEKLVVVQS
jgi:hypothetical protein